jgi:hypothetical protein
VARQKYERGPPYGLQGAMSPKMATLVTAAVRASNPARCLNLPTLVVQSIPQ